MPVNSILATRLISTASSVEARARRAASTVERMPVKTNTAAAAGISTDA